jgi:hypothetical protein
MDLYKEFCNFTIRALFRSSDHIFSSTICDAVSKENYLEKCEQLDAVENYDNRHMFYISAIRAMIDMDISLFEIERYVGSAQYIMDEFDDLYLKTKFKSRIEEKCAMITKENNTESSLLKLPPEILLHVTRYLDNDDLYPFSMACTTTYNVFSMTGRIMKTPISRVFNTVKAAKEIIIMASMFTRESLETIPLNLVRAMFNDRYKRIFDKDLLDMFLRSDKGIMRVIQLDLMPEVYKSHDSIVRTNATKFYTLAIRHGSQKIIDYMCIINVFADKSLFHLALIYNMLSDNLLLRIVQCLNTRYDRILKYIITNKKYDILRAYNPKYIRDVSAVEIVARNGDQKAYEILRGMKALHKQSFRLLCNKDQHDLMVKWEYRDRDPNRPLLN